jgi:hypothetical protein
VRGNMICTNLTAVACKNWMILPLDMHAIPRIEAPKVEPSYDATLGQKVTADQLCLQAGK